QETTPRPEKIAEPEPCPEVGKATEPAPPTAWERASELAGKFVDACRQCRPCLIKVYSSDPNRRMIELLNTSEDLRQIEHDGEQGWFTDEPTHMTPERVHGGIK